MQDDRRVDVEFCGWQERLKGPSVLLVTNLKTKSTVVYNGAKHRIVGQKGGADGN